MISQVCWSPLSGIVVEADLLAADTVAVGYVDIGGASYYWYGQTWDTTHESVKKFGGNEITVVKGGFGKLHAIATDENTQLAVRQTEEIVGAYPILGASIARATFDVVQGTAHNGSFLSGVTDPSVRPSASSPAEIYAVEAFNNFPEAQSITTRVVYDYGHNELSDLPGRELFARSAKTSIYVDLVDVT